MLTGTWKSVVLKGTFSAAAASVLGFSLYEMTDLPLVGVPGFAAWLFLLISATSGLMLCKRAFPGEESGPQEKSISDAAVYLSLLLFVSHPAYAIGPVVLLAALLEFVSSYSASGRRAAIMSTGNAAIALFLTGLLYSFLARALLGESSYQPGQMPVTGLLLLCVVSLAHYLLRRFMTDVVSSRVSAASLIAHSKERLLWASVIQFASASSAAMFYVTFEGAGVAFAFIGLLLLSLVRMLHLFDKRRVEEIRGAEAEKARHLREVAEIHMNTVESLAIAIDAKDQTTHGHVRRTQLYAAEMGRVLGVSEGEVLALRAGALLHDIGKLAVPEYILNKPGKLTESEFAKMKIHPVVGGDILSRVNFPYPVEDIVRYHHEKWDGTGYPKGLKGADIPLVARIISVVDFYDATRCDRPYRTGMTREASLDLLRKMAGSSFDPRVVESFIKHVEEFDTLIAAQDIREQVADVYQEDQNEARPDAGLASDVLGDPDASSGFRSITEAQREVFALHEIAQTIGSSLNLSDTVALVSSKLKSIVPFDTCVIYLVDERTGKAVPTHVAGQHEEAFSKRRVTIGEGITGWVIANARSMCNSAPQLDLVGVAEDVSKSMRGIIVSPLIKEDGAFGAITLFSKSVKSYTSEHVRLLESVCQHAASALNNAMTFERTRESALTDLLTNLPNARAFYMMLEQRIAECERMNREPLALVCLDIDDFKKINDTYGHAIGDRLLSGVASVMKQEFRQMDILARYAGDEFVAIMPMASATMAGSVAERIRMKVEATQFYVKAQHSLELKISVGVSSFPADGETTEQLLSAAARNMQRNKHTRKLLPGLAGLSSISSVEQSR